MLSQKEDSLLKEVASAFNMNKQDLYDVINFESDWNPTIRNKRGSSARGLIQFMGSTAKKLKYIDEKGNIKYFSSSDDLIARCPTIESQLKLVDKANLNSASNGPVVQYFAGSGIRKVSSPSIHDIAAAIFMPAAIGKPLNTPLISFLSDKDKIKFPLENPGIDNMEDYVNKVIRKNGKKSALRIASSNKKEKPDADIKAGNVISAVGAGATVLGAGLSATAPSDTEDQELPKGGPGIAISDMELEDHIKNISSYFS